MKPFGAISVFLVAFAASTQFGLAQTDPGQKLIDDQMRAEQQKRLDKNSGGLDTKQDQRFAPVIEAQCFPIDNIHIRGVTALDPENLTRLLKEFSGKCLGQQSIGNLTAAITSTYVELGYVTTRAYIPAQDVSSGTLLVEVLEGRIEAYIYQQVDEYGSTRAGKPRKIAGAFPSQAGELFQLRDIEHGLEQINRLPSSNANANLIPGNAPGTSIVVVTEQKQDLIRGSFSMDNKGSAATGTTQVRLGLEADDLFGINDMVSLSYSGSKNTNALALTGSVPYRKWLFSTSASYSESLSTLSPISDLFTQSMSFSLKAERLLSRNAKGKYYAYVSLSQFANSRLINIVPLTPQKRSTYTLGFRMERYFATSVLSADFKLTNGAHFWGADTDPLGIALTTPHAGFTKASAQISWQKGFSNGMTLTTSGSVQYGNVALFSSDQISIGGWDTVRGFSGFGASGDLGYYIRNELTFARSENATPPNLWKPDTLLDRAFGGHQLQTRKYSFLDFGAINQISTGSTIRLAGLGLGFSASVGRISFGAEAAIPIFPAAGQSAGEFQAQLYATIKLF